MHTHKIVNGERVDLTPEEIAELNAKDEAFVPPPELTQLTKEELLAQLQALSEKINALG